MKPSSFSFQGGCSGTGFFSCSIAFSRFFGAMLDRGVLLPPSQFEAWFLSLAHGDAELEVTIDAARSALAG